MPHPPGTSGLFTLATPRYHSFTRCWKRLQEPPGTEPLHVVGKDVVKAQNELAEEMKGEWLLLMNDDHTFGADLLIRLLDRNVDIVTPLNVERQKPFMPLIFSERGDQWTWKHVGTATGLISVPACGSGGMVIRRRVFEAMDAPWFETRKDGPYQGSDLVFCLKAREAGFKVHVDLDVVMGHTNDATFIPARGEDGMFGVFTEVQGQFVSYLRF